MGNESDSGTPWWARSIKYYGPLVVMCFLLIGIITGLIPTSIKDAWTTIGEIKSIAVQNRATAKEEHEDLEDTLDTGNQLLRGICLGVNRDLPRAEQQQLCNY